MRGVGSIAAIDAVTDARRRQQAFKTRVMNRIDRRHARVTYGPNRALPVPLGAVSKIGTGIMSSTQPVLRGGGSIDVPPPPQPTAELPPRVPVRPTPPPSPVPPKPIPVVIPPLVRPIRTTSVSTGTGSGGSTGVPGNGLTPGTDSSGGSSGGSSGSGSTKPPPVIVTGGGGGGGAGVSSGGGTDVGEPVDTESLPMPEESSSSMSTGTKVALALGGLGLLYLLTREDR
jgi:hypothetical protein